MHMRPIFGSNIISQYMATDVEGDYIKTGLEWL